jgi:hypothetical protein
MILIEGRWGAEPVGLAAVEIEEMLAPLFVDVACIRLDNLDGLWGAPVTDERFAIIARQP